MHEARRVEADFRSPLQHATLRAGSIPSVEGASQERAVRFGLHGPRRLSERLAGRARSGLCSRGSASTSRRVGPVSFFLLFESSFPADSKPLPCSVKQYVVDLLDDLSDDPAMRQVSFDSVPVYTHVPMLPLPVPAKHVRGKVLTHAVIAGSFHSTSKDYSSVLNALLAELSGPPPSLSHLYLRPADLGLPSTADPVPWGYHPLSSSSPSFAPNSTDAIPSFVLHLVGHGHLSVPKELEHAVLVHNSLSSYQYYSAMAMMDVILPAFVPRTSSGGGSCESHLSLSAFCFARSALTLFSIRVRSGSLRLPIKLGHSPLADGRGTPAFLPSLLSCISLAHLRRLPRPPFPRLLSSHRSLS